MTAAVFIGVVAGCGGTSVSHRDPLLTIPVPTRVTVQAQPIAGLGVVLTDGQGDALYMFPPDAGSRVSCTGPCAGTWPPLVIAAGHQPTAGSGGINAQDLSTLADPNTGARIITYGGYPLYRYAGDVDAGHGQRARVVPQRRPLVHPQSRPSAGHHHPGERLMNDSTTPAAGRRLVGRRSLLTGAAGLVIGVGATETINALTATASAPAGSRLASPGEALMTEHGILKRVLLAYRAASQQLATGTVPPNGAVADAAQIISDYVESFHEGLEEAYVFPRVRTSNPDLVQTLLAQHDKGRHLTARILAVAATDLTSAVARADLQRSLDQFVRMYEPHEAWEDTVIYPALRAQSSQQTLDELAERFHDLENTQYGDDALFQILGRVTGVEQMLGIADLAIFTPT